MRTMVLIGMAALAAAPTQASREGRIDFDLSIAGIPIGDASMTLTLEGGAEAIRYTLHGAADFGFLFWGGVGEARAEGALDGGVLRPSSYRLAYEGVTRPGAVAIDFEGGQAVRWERQPPISPEFSEGRLPVTAEHLQGVLDPLSALVIAAPAEVAPAALCDRVQPVFSGYTRFDLAFVAAGPVTDGAVACESRYRAVSGHRAESRGVARMREPGALQVALAPLAPGLWGPARVAVSTRFGTFEMLRRTPTGS